MLQLSFSQPNQTSPSKKQQLKRHSRKGRSTRLPWSLTSRASSVMNPDIENPSMMSSSAEVDSFLFLLGGLGREEEEGLVLSSLSDSEENRSMEPRTWLFLIPLDTRPRSRTDRDFRFFRIPLHRGPSISPDDTLKRTLPVRRLSACAQRWMQNDFQTNTCNGKLNNCTPVRYAQLSKFQNRLML